MSDTFMAVALALVVVYLLYGVFVPAIDSYGITELRDACRQHGGTQQIEVTPNNFQLDREAVIVCVDGSIQTVEG